MRITGQRVVSNAVASPLTHPPSPAADAVIYLRIFEMVAARYNVADLQTAIMNLVLTQLREEMGKLTLDEVSSSDAGRGDPRGRS